MKAENWKRLLFFIAVTIGCVVLVAVAIKSDINRRDNQYAAWVKLTGNPHGLTRSEWDSCTQKMLEDKGGKP